jgi:hypothetical protein
VLHCEGRRAMSGAEALRRMDQVRTGWGSACTDPNVTPSGLACGDASRVVRVDVRVVQGISNQQSVEPVSWHGSALGDGRPSPSTWPLDDKLSRRFLSDFPVPGRPA